MGKVQSHLWKQHVLFSEYSRIPLSLLLSSPGSPRCGRGHLWAPARPLRPGQVRRGPRSPWSQGVREPACVCRSWSHVMVTSSHCHCNGSWLFLVAGCVSPSLVFPHSAVKPVSKRSGTCDGKSRWQVIKYVVSTYCHCVCDSKLIEQSRIALAGSLISPQTQWRRIFLSPFLLFCS